MKTFILLVSLLLTACGGDDSDPDCHFSYAGQPTQCTTTQPGN